MDWAPKRRKATSARRGVLASFSLGFLMAAPVVAGESPEPEEPAPTAPVHGRAVLPGELAVEEVERWIAEHPKQHAEGIKRLRALLPTARGASADQIESRIRQLEVAMERASGLAWRSAGEREAEAKEQFARACRLIQLRPGPQWAAENLRALSEALELAEGTLIEELVWRRLEEMHAQYRFGSPSRERAAGPKEGAEINTGRSSPGLGLRMGLGDYLHNTDHRVYPRTSLGLYYYFAESDSRRLECSVDFLRSKTAPAENRYLALRFDYVSYVEGAGSFFWSAGGGAVLEKVYGEQGTFGLLDAGIGTRLNLGERKLDFHFGIQTPIGRELNVPWLLLFSVAYDL